MGGNALFSDWRKNSSHFVSELGVSPKDAELEEEEEDFVHDVLEHLEGLEQAGNFDLGEDSEPGEGFEQKQHFLFSSL